MVRKIYGLLIFFSLGYHLVSAQVTFVVESLPKTTPANDSIFLAGTFNNWSTNDPKYLLEKQPNGQLSLTINPDAPIIEYKFTRGDWLKVETGEDNGYIANRMLENDRPDQTVLIKIQNWQDLGGARNFEYLIFYYFSTAFLSLLLVALSGRIFKKEPTKRKAFVLGNGLIIILFIGTVIYYVVSPIWQTYVLIMSQIVIFLWGPCLYMFLKPIITREDYTIASVYFIPALVATILAALRLLNMEVLSFLSTSFNGLITWGKLLSWSVGGVLVLIFLLKLVVEERGLLLRTNGVRAVFSTTFLFINGLGLLMIGLNLYLEYNSNSEFAYLGYKSFFVIISVLVWLEGIAIWKDPNFFRDKPHLLHIDSADQLLTRLKYLMEEEKVYREAELNVNRLAALMDTKPHILSKLLNEHYEQNFRDFVNCYRIEEFIQLANQGRLQNLTYLGLAHEVGFNSKSTFNLAFKKFTHQSPREYFKSPAV